VPAGVEHQPPMAHRHASSLVIRMSARCRQLYPVVGFWLGLPTLLVGWGYAIVRLGFLLGFWIGWLPAGLLALLVFYAWPALLVAGVAIGLHGLSR